MFCDQVMSTADATTDWGSCKLMSQHRKQSAKDHMSVIAPHHRSTVVCGNTPLVPVHKRTGVLVFEIIDRF